MKNHRSHSYLLLLFDVVAVFLVFNLGGWLRGIAGPERWIVTPLIGPLIIVVIAIYLIDGYRSRTEMMGADYTSQHIVALLVALIVTLLLTYVVIPEAFSLQGSRLVLTAAFVVLAGLTLTYRRSIHRWVKFDQRDRVVLFVGNRAAGISFVEVCRNNRLEQTVICAVIGETEGAPIQVDSDSAIRSYEDVLTEIKSGALRIEAIVLRESAGALPGNMTDDITALFFRGIPTYTLELFFETYWRKIPLYRINHIWLFQEGFQIARNPVFERTKRAVDIVLASLGLILSAPLMLLAVIAIKMEDGGPVLFRQTRVGRLRKPFQIIKLRSMKVNNDATGVNRYTQDADPRITKVGAFLRKSRLDEVPQLLNVIGGEMSLIGPRAEWDQLVSDYESGIPCYHYRHLVRPGITGWAQINYPYGANIDDTLRKLEYDLYYIRHFSFVMDAAIVLRTINIMLFGKGR
jgi:exopolysaccharide biosynthesis polyprenyl glycosylphosphotransferase